MVVRRQLLRRHFSIILFLIAAAALAAAGFLLCRGVLLPNYIFASGYRIRGMDVSGHQKAVDWPAVSRQGKIKFAYIKATEGSDFKDASFKANWRGALQAGITRGAYHYFVMTSPGHLQAANFIETVPKAVGSLPPVIDIELDITDKRAVEQQLNDLITDLVSYYNQNPVLYFSYKDYYVLGDDYKSSRVWIRDIAGPPSVAGWKFWQYSDRGGIDGVAGRVDLDVFRGDNREFNSLLSK
jgi:lysozyme